MLNHIVVEQLVREMAKIVGDAVCHFARQSRLKIDGGVESSRGQKYFMKTVVLSAMCMIGVDSYMMLFFKQLFVSTKKKSRKSCTVLSASTSSCAEFL